MKIAPIEIEAEAITANVRKVPLSASAATTTA